MSDSALLAKIERSYSGYDNLYIIERCCRRAVFNLKRTKVKPELFRLIKSMLKETDYELNSEILKQYLSGLDDDDICKALDVAALIILRKLPADEITEQTEKYVKALYFIDRCDFKDLFAEISQTEQYLRKNDDVYCCCTEETQSLYRRNITAYAKKHGISNIEAAKIMGLKAAEPAEHPFMRKLYFFIIWGITAVLFVLCAAFTEILPALLLILPFSELAKSAADFIYGRLAPAGYIARLKLDNIPDDSVTLTVITSLLFGNGKDEYLLDKLERFYLSNKDKNAVFGILGDFKDSDSLSSDADEKITSYAVKRINELNSKYGNKFCLFIRRRVYSSSEHRYMGWERKRGAVIELTRFIKGRETTIETAVCDDKLIHSVKYVITLDSDTILYTGAVKEMVGTMLHPVNKPIVRGKTVVKGYAIMQPRMDTALISASRSPFSVMLTGSGGTDIYSSASFDTYQTIFGEGVFCGKGIFDVDIFYNLIDKAFPEEVILSHDILEGTRLRAAYLSDIALTDSCPQNPLAYFSRLHRWIRGDIQALPYAGDGINRLSQYKIFDNLRRILTPIAAVSALTAGIFFNAGKSNIIFISALAYLLFPVVISFFTASDKIARRFFSYVLQGIWHTFCNMLYNISALLHTALLSLDAVLRSVIRMCITHRHMLEWVTASEHEFKVPDGVPLYLRRMLPSCIAGLLLCIFAPYGSYKVLGAMWFLLPLTSYMLSREYKNADSPTDEQKSQLTKYSFDMWKYYVDFADSSNNWLPPDNYQISPVEALARRTSPTNIGLYMLSCLAALDFGFISVEQLGQRLENVISSLKRMQKWHGHLYNWYDTSTLDILGTPYISTVDSGNFVSAIVALKEGIRQYTAELPCLKAVYDDLETLINAADFKYLYNTKRDLFYIGYNAELNEYSESCYDIFMSEARTTSYYAVASGTVPKSHWSKLGRILTGKDGYIGLLSWTGTMFEYFMPSLLLPIYKNSLTYEALNFTLKLQRESSFNHLWGRSECGYFSFDADMNYQYKAVGVQRLGLKRGLSADNVIAPYASFLTLCSRRKASLDNLSKLCEFGMYGKYGFYEAVDFTNSRVGKGNAVIRSFMAHHTGMSMIAADNACNGNIFCRRFMSDPYMSSAQELLQEKIPVDGVILKNRENPISVNSKPLNHDNIRFTHDNANALRTAVVSNNKTKVIASSNGEISISDGKILLAESLKLKCMADGKIFDACAGLFRYNDDCIRYENDMRSIRTETTLSVSGKMSCVNINISAEGHFGQFCPMIVFTPVLTSESDYKSHPAFSKLSVEAEYLHDENILLYKRRPRLENERETWLAVTLENFGGVVEFATRADDVLPLMYSENDINALISIDLLNQTGACINPICVMKRHSLTKSGKYECDFLMSTAHSKTEAAEIIKSARIEKKRRYMHTFKQSNYMNCGETLYTEILLTSITHRLNKTNTLDVPASQNDLWAYGISGDLPIACIETNSKICDITSSENILAGFIDAYRSLTVKGIRFDLIILFSETEKYSAPIRNMLSSIVKKCGCELMTGQRGGIYLINSCNADILRSVSVFYADLNSIITAESIYRKYITFRDNPHKTGYVTKIQNQLSDKCGFKNDGYTVIKGAQRSPWSYVYSSRQFGTLVTQNSLGFAWWSNSREQRITPWSNDALLDCSGERIIMNLDGIDYDLCAISNKVEFKHGEAVYYGKVNAVSYKIHVGIDSKLMVKLIWLELSDFCTVRFEITPCMGVSVQYPHLIKETYTEDTRFFRNYFSADTSDKTGYLTSICSGSEYFFLLGVFSAENDALYRIVRGKYQTSNDIKCGLANYAEKAEDLFKHISINTGSIEFDKMVNYYLPYQAVYTRIFARTGFYQSGGAYGFRDQLQDSLSALYSDPNITKIQILRASAHQYTQGDVMHWWHSINGKSRGVRTHCSDDFLWLPFASAVYAEHTGDYGIFDMIVPYLDSEPLGINESDRYETPQKSKYRESLYMHCVRAIERAFNFGCHGIPLIGSGDWNDGFSRVGIGGSGESVWLGWFLRLVLRKFIPVCELRHDTDGAEKYVEIEKALAENLEKYCWDGKWYLRAFRDDGSKLGADGNEECKIDMLPQAFAGIVNGYTERSKTALDNAYMYLYDTKFRLCKLFTPPFKKIDGKTGYIEGYVPGIRENGGQYTHAAIWAAWGYMSIGENERGFEILNGINPASRDVEIYRNEPYSMSGDIYTNPEHYGRGGWSQYTGAAGWYFSAVIGELAGYKRYGDYFTVAPKLSEQLPEFKLRLNVEETQYEIYVHFGEANSCMLDFKIVNNKFYFDKSKHFLEITVEKKSKLL